MPIVPFEEESVASFGGELQILPGDYTIIAVSRIDGERATGRMRLYRSSPADSGRYSYTGGWVHVAPEDTIGHPLYGVTTVDFTQTLVDTTTSLDALARDVDPVYPQILVGRRESPAGQRFSWTLFVDTVWDRDSVFSLDGGGSALSVDQLEAGGFFSGWYYRAGIIGTDNGFYCAWRQSGGEAAAASSFLVRRHGMPSHLRFGSMLSWRLHPEEAGRLLQLPTEV